MNEEILILDAFILTANCKILQEVNKIIVCCKRKVVKKILSGKLLNGKRIRKTDIMKQQSVLLYKTNLYLFVDKYVDSGTIDHYFGAVNRAYNMMNVECTIKGTNNNFRKATLRRLLNQHCRLYVESESFSDDSLSS